MPPALSPRLLSRLLAGWEEAGRGPAYARLASAIGGALLDGRLVLHARMPSERELAVALAVSRTTIAAAYSRLRDDGFLVSRRGAGSWTTLPDRPTRGVTALLPGSADGDGIVDLAVAAPGPDPELIMAAMAAAGDMLPHQLVAQPGAHGYHPAGLASFRDAVAARYTARGVPTTGAHVLATPGAQGALHLIAERLVSPGDVVVIEHPTYPNAVDAFRRTSARLVPVTVTAAGWPGADDGQDGVEEMVRTLEQVRPKLAYLIVDFHNPTSALLNAAGRERLVAAARRAGTLLVIDETVAELSLDGQELPPPVAAFDRDGRVITVGSMSKVFWGGLRLGWLRAGPRLVAELATARSSVDLAGPVLEQLVGTQLLAQPEAALAKRRTQIAGQRDHLLAGLTARFPEWTWSAPGGGLSVWVTLDAPVSTALADAAERHRLRLVPGPRFGIDGTLERFVRLPYALPVEQLDLALDRLAAARADLDVTAPSVPTPTMIA